MLSGLALGSKSKYGDFSSGTDSGFARVKYGVFVQKSSYFNAAGAVGGVTMSPFKHNANGFVSLKTLFSSTASY